MDCHDFLRITSQQHSGRLWACPRPQQPPDKSVSFVPHVPACAAYMLECSKATDDTSSHLVSTGETGGTLQPGKGRGFIEESAVSRGRLRPPGRRCQEGHLAGAEGPADGRSQASAQSHSNCFPAGAACWPSPGEPGVHAAHWHGLCGGRPRAQVGGGAPQRNGRLPAVRAPDVSPGGKQKGTHWLLWQQCRHEN